MKRDDHREDQGGKPEENEDRSRENLHSEEQEEKGEGPDPEEEGGSEMVYGTCRYCKQMKIAYPYGTFSQEDADEQATEGCDCRGARNARELQRRYNEALEHIQNMIGGMQSNGAIQEGEEITELAEEAMQTAMDSVWNGIFDSVGFAIDGTKITISKPKGKLKFSKRRTLTADLEF